MRQLDYYTFMGYPAEVLKERYRRYAELLADSAVVIDVACGRGEFLELLRAAGVEARGVDADESMVAECRRRGLTADVADGTEFLRRHPSEFGGVFAAHLIEHLAPEQLRAFVEAAAEALRPGGRLVLVTPNPANLQMQLHDFWIDLQHVRFYSPEIVRWLLSLAGLRQVEDGVNALYRSGPDLERMPPLPTPMPPRRRVGRESLARALPPSIDNRLEQLERTVNELAGWAKSLYPPAEYYVTGIR